MKEIKGEEYGRVRKKNGLWSIIRSLFYLWAFLVYEGIYNLHVAVIVGSGVNPKQMHSKPFYTSFNILFNIYFNKFLKILIL